MLKRFAYYTIILLLSLYILLLFANSQLTFYMHPRYINFTVGMAAVATVFAFVGLGSALRGNHRTIWVNARKVILTLVNDRKLMLFIFSLLVAVFVNLFFIVAAMLVLLPFPRSEFDKFLQRNVWGEALLIGVLLIGFLLPARPLSSATATQRALDFNALNVSDKLDVVQPFSFSSDKYSIGDWVKSLNINPDVDFYVSKQVNISGFVYNPSELDDTYFLLARFVITCCAVDARPVGIPILYDTQGLVQDEWVEVKGKFAAADINGKPTVIILPESVTKIDIPNDPYIY